MVDTARPGQRQRLTDRRSSAPDQEADLTTPNRRTDSYGRRRRRSAAGEECACQKSVGGETGLVSGNRTSGIVRSVFA